MVWSHSSSRASLGCVTCMANSILGMITVLMTCTSISGVRGEEVIVVSILCSPFVRFVCCFLKLSRAVSHTPRYLNGVCSSTSARSVGRYRLCVRLHVGTVIVGWGPFVLRLIWNVFPAFRHPALTCRNVVSASARSLMPSKVALIGIRSSMNAWPCVCGASVGCCA